MEVCDKEGHNHQLYSSKGNSHHQLEAMPAAKMHHHGQGVTQLSSSSAGGSAVALYARSALVWHSAQLQLVEITLSDPGRTHCHMY